MAGLVLGTDENFYGTTFEGGAGNEACINGRGTVFKLTPDGNVDYAAPVRRDGRILSLRRADPGNRRRLLRDNGFWRGLQLLQSCEHPSRLWHGIQDYPLRGIFTVPEGTALLEVLTGVSPYASGLVEGTDGNLYWDNVPRWRGPRLRRNLQNHARGHANDAA